MTRVGFVAKSRMWIECIFVSISIYIAAFVLHGLATHVEIRWVEPASNSASHAVATSAEATR